MRLLMSLVPLLLLSPLFAWAAVPVPEDYVVSAKDTLDVVVFEEPQLCREVVVAEDGTIDYPLLGTLHLKGLTRQQVDELVTSRLEANYLHNPQVTIYVTAMGSKTVEVHGAVVRPGAVHLTGGQTNLLQILGEVGGIDARKTASQVIVRRQDSPPMVINLESLFNSGQDNIVLQPDDYVFVPEAKVVYVAGEVKRPGTITWAHNLSVSQALTQAGGPDETASLRSAYILRDGERIAVNLRRIYKGSESDIILEPDDQLFLRQSVF